MTFQNANTPPFPKQATTSVSKTQYVRRCIGLNLRTASKDLVSDIKKMASLELFYAV